MALKALENYTESASGCHEFQGAISSSGYPNIGYEGKTWKGHRLSWARVNGAIPDGLCVLHKCDNRKCINPDHLFLGTKQDNTNDMKAKGRDRKSTGEAHGNSRFSDSDVADMRRSYADGETQVSIARRYETYQGVIGNIVRGNSRAGGEPSLS